MFPNPPSAADPPDTFAARWKAAVAGAMLAITDRVRFWPLALPLILLVKTKVDRLNAKLQKMLLELEAGTLRPPRPRGTPRNTATAPPDRPRRRLPERLPFGRAWLRRLAPELPRHSAALEALLAAPEIADLLAAAPLAGRTLRPLWRLLVGKPLPPLLKPPRRPRRPRPDRPPGVAPVRYAIQPKPWPELPDWAKPPELRIGPRDRIPLGYVPRPPPPRPLTIPEILVYLDLWPPRRREPHLA